MILGAYFVWPELLYEISVLRQNGRNGIVILILEEWCSLSFGYKRVHLRKRYKSAELHACTR